MAVVGQQSAFTAFESQLRTLCLREFPCGGKHVERGNSKLNADITNSRFSITHKDYGPQYEKSEILEEYVKAKKSPWNLDYSWSDEARSLREIAVKSPWLIDNRFILSHFKSLRIVDRDVIDVDENFKKFANLEQLILSANHLETVKSANLPTNLQVLELCANQLSSLEDLCIQPVPLIHLGLGHNVICRLDEYITGQYWPSLLSLDLSHNNLTDLIDVIGKLNTLPKLRNLVLQGNPLGLIPAYRGYVIDSLRSLEFLDDTLLSADEKHHYKGLARHKEFILDEARITLQVDFIKGLLQPDELRFPDEQPEFPIITHKYYVEFRMLQGCEREELISPLTDATHMTNRSTDKESVNGAEKTDKKIPDKEVKDEVTAMENEVAAEGGEGQNEEKSPCNTSGLDPELNKEEEEENQLIPVICEKNTWLEDIQVNWQMVLVRDDLLALRDFLQQGIDLAVIEEKVTSYPADQCQDGVPSPAPGKDKKKDKKDDKKKEEDPKKKKKKKGEPDIEMVHLPSEFTTLATFHIPTDDFLEGEHVFENVYMKTWEERRGTQTPMSDISTASKKKKGDKKGDKKEKDVRKSPKTDRKGSGKTDRKGSGKNDKKKSVSENKDEEVEAPPPPLEVHTKVRLHHWRTAADALTESQPSQQDSHSQAK